MSVSVLICLMSKSILGLFGQQYIDFGHILIWVPKLGKPGKKIM